MIYQLTHTTTYQYSGAVSLSHHVLRLLPREVTRQRCLQSELLIDPKPDVLCTHPDYFGNDLTFVTIEGLHKNLVITARHRVQVLPAVNPEPEKTPPWEQARHTSLNGEAQAILPVHEFCFSSPLIETSPEFGAYAGPAFAPGRPVLEAVLDLTKRMHADFQFDPAATSVATPLMEVFRRRRGVCQDFAHLQIGFLRTMGIAARYVSGYLETDPPPGKPRLAGTDASHAWVSFFCPGIGWIDVDPTNNLLVSDRHITVAWGRDYTDVCPVRGIIIGSGDHTMSVAVDVIPVAEPGSFDAALMPVKDSALPQA